MRGALREAGKVIQAAARAAVPVLKVPTVRRSVGTVKKNILVRASKFCASSGRRRVYINVRGIRGKARVKKLGRGAPGIRTIRTTGSSWSSARARWPRDPSCARQPPPAGPEAIRKFMDSGRAADREAQCQEAVEMSVESDFYSLLSGNAGVTAQVSRLYPDGLPEACAYPAIVFARARTEPTLRLSGQVFGDDVDLSVGCWAKTRTEADEAADAVEAAWWARPSPASRARPPWTRKPACWPRFSR